MPNHDIAMISLVGEQPMPNVIVNMEYLPSESYFLTTSDVVDTVYPHLKTLLEGKGIRCEHRLVHPFDYEANEEACLEILTHVEEGKRVLFNVTGGTKVMALAAFAVAAGLGHEVVYLDTDGNRVLTLSPASAKSVRPVTYRVDVETCLKARGQSIKETERRVRFWTRPEIREIALGMGRRAAGISDLLYQIRTHYNNNNFSRIEYEFTGDEVSQGQQRSILGQLHRHGLIQGYTRS